MHLTKERITDTDLLVKQKQQIYLTMFIHLKSPYFSNGNSIDFLYQLFFSIVMEIYELNAIINEEYLSVFLLISSSLTP